jgi:tetratricopeptide (TPR) repeat protein
MTYSSGSGTRSAIFHIVFLVMLITLPAVSQVSETDSLLLLQQVNSLIERENYASAHLLMEEYLQSEGINPFFSCKMVQNGLNHYFKHENYQIFLLRDETPESVQTGTNNIRIGRLRHPTRILENVIRLYSGKAIAYKLLGDYYNIQLKDISNFEYVQQNKVSDLEEKIYTYYSQAEKLGYEDSYINRWLGDYYINKNQTELAEKYYLKNSRNKHEDPISLYRLAEIYYQRKLYTRAFNFANRSLDLFSPEDIYLRYDALRLSSNSLKELGDESRFINLINQCIQLIPEQQSAYLDLSAYYASREEFELAEEIYRQMFFANPFELRGYRQFEIFLNQYKNYEFADTLFDDLQLMYDNWDEVMANIYWSKGNLAFQQNLKNEASRFWEISRNYMRKYLPENHSLIKQVGELRNGN